jgi:hypothetical protein
MVDNQALVKKSMSLSAWIGYALLSVIVNVIELFLLLYPVALGSAFIAHLLHWLWAGSTAGGFVVLLILNFILWTVVVTLGFATVTLLSRIFMSDRRKAARVACFTGSPVWIFFALFNLLIISEPTLAAFLLPFGFCVTIVGQFLAVRRISRMADPAVTVPASHTSDLELQNQYYDLLASVNLHEANQKATRYLSMLETSVGSSARTFLKIPAKQTSAEPAESLGLLLDRLVAMNRMDEAEAVSALHLKLIEQTDNGTK